MKRRHVGVPNPTPGSLRVSFVMFKKRAAVFYRGLKPRGVDPIKHVLRVF